MNQNSPFKAFVPHLIAVAIFTVLTWIYLLPQIEGKQLEQHDIVQSHAMQGEVRAYHEKTGEYVRWTNSMFSGMPSYQILTDYPSSLVAYIINAIKAVYPETAHLVFLLMLGFYILLFTYTKNPWVSVIAAIGFAFSSYNFINIDAGHTSKVRCIALMAPIVGGFIAAYRGRYLFGAAFTALVLAIQIRSNHFQITYYTMLVCAMIGLFYLVMAIRQSQLPQFAKATGVLLLAIGLGFGSNASQLWTTFEYSKETIRGGTSELSAERLTGLDKDYAFSYSYGKLETFTLLIPNFMGGASAQALDENSNLGKELVKMGMQKDKVKDILEYTPTYWGSQRQTAGPTYFGIISCFLFVFGMFLIRNPIKWIFFSITVLAILLAWGGNFEAFNSLLFNYFPFYNKFRTPAMILSVANVAVVFVAGLAIYEVLTTKLSRQEIKKALIRAIGITAGLVFVVGVAGSYVFDFVKEANVSEGIEGDKALIDGGWPIAALRADRAAMMRMDALRSLFLIALAAGALWMYLENKIKRNLLLIGLGAMVLVDTWQISKRYLNDKDFKPASEVAENFKPSKADLEILKDTDPYYRVLDFTAVQGLFNDALPSYHHKTIGGYHAAKIRRYQDLIEKQIGPNLQHLDGRFSNEDVPVLNMLNLRYIIMKGDQVARNPNAMGNAWFVPQYVLVENAAAEMDSLNHFNPSMKAFVDKRFESYLSGLPSSMGTAAGTIALTSYHPEKLTYKSISTQEQLAVFSDVYYDKGWEASIDGKPVEHIRVNYVLRGLRIPAGEHAIEFSFHPKSYYTGEKISLACSALTLLLVIGVIVNELRKPKPATVASKPSGSVKKSS